MRKNYFIGLFFLIVCGYSTLYSQTHTNELWTELGVSSEIVYNLQAEAIIETRFQEVGSYIKSISGEVGVSYKLIKPISVGITYKCTEKNRPQGFFAAHTGAFTFSYRQKYGNVRVAYRNKFEINRDTYINEYTDLYPQFEDRNRFKLSYARKKAFISPSLSIETFHTGYNQSQFLLSEIRYSCGVDFNLKNKFEASTAYTYKQSFGKSVNTSIYSISVSKSF